MNRKIKIFMSCMVALFIGLISFIGIKQVNAYELDSNNNIVSDNICDIQDYSSTNVNVNNNNISLTGVSGFNWIPLNQTINTSQTIYVELFGSGDLNNVEIFLAYASGDYTNRYRVMWYDTLYTLNLSWNVNYLFIYNQSGNVNNLNIMISYSTITEYEPFGTWYNESYLDRKNLGVLGDLDYVQPIVNNQPLSEYSINDLYNNNYITNDSSINLVRISDNVNAGYQPIEFYFHYNTIYTTILASNFNLVFSNSHSMINYFKINGEDTNGNSISYNVPIDTLPTYFRLSDYDSNLYTIEEFFIFFNSAYDVCNINGNTSYYEGYNSGLEVASRWEQMYNDLTNAFNTLKNQYDNLLSQYNDYINGNTNFNTLIWNIATIPFESFKQIWNVEILGLNIGNFCIALMSVGVLLYIWKKFI